MCILNKWIGMQYRLDPIPFHLMSKLISCSVFQSGPESMINLISQSSESQSGGSVRDGMSWGKPLSAKSYSPVQSQNEYSLNPMHVIHVKLPGLPYIPRVPILTNTPSSSPPHQNAPVCSPRGSSQKSPWSEWDANTRDTPSGSASNPNVPTSVQLPSLLDDATLQGLGIDLGGRQRTRRGRGRCSRGRGRGRPRGGRGGRHYRRSTRGRGRTLNRPVNTSQKHRSVFPFTLPVADVPDPIPGRMLKIAATFHSPDKFTWHLFEVLPLHFIS